MRGENRLRRLASDDQLSYRLSLRVRTNRFRERTILHYGVEQFIPYTNRIVNGGQQSEHQSTLRAGGLIVPER